MSILVNSDEPNVTHEVTEPRVAIEARQASFRRTTRESAAKAPTSVAKRTPASAHQANSTYWSRMAIDGS